MNRPRLSVITSCLLLLALMIGCQGYTPRPGDELLPSPAAYNGIELAYPRYFEGDLNLSTQSWTAKASLLKAILTVNKNGQVKDIEIDWSNQPSVLSSWGTTTPVDWVNSKRWQSYDSLLHSLEFIPGRYNDKRVSQKIPILITDNPKDAKANILFPIGPAGVVTDADLYWRTVRLNGGELPEIINFPTYFIISDKKQVTTKLDYLLSRISFESDSTVEDFELLHSDAGQFTSQILSAANWGEFAPVTNEKSKIVDDAFLVVALYKLAGYPTTVIDSLIDSLRLPDQNRIRLVADTLGLMFKPFPTTYPEDGLYSVLGGRMDLPDTLNILVRISEKGIITKFNPVGGSRGQSINYIKWAQWLKFYPALDFTGQPQSFTGVMRMEYKAGTIIRIKFCWLPGECGCYSF